MSFLREIKRIKVFQVAAMYLVAGWLIVQVIDVVKEPLQLPAWLHPVVIIVVAIGFPIVLMLSWAFELTRGGVVAEHYVEDDDVDDTDRHPEGIRPSEAISRNANLAIGAVAAVSLAIAGYLTINFISSDSVTKPLVADGPAREFTVELPRNLTNAWRGGRPVTIAADGQRIFFNASIDERWQLYSRSLNSVEVSPVAGTDNASFYSAVSPDGEWLAYIDGNDVLKKVPITGGVAVELCDTRGFFGDNLAWGPNDVIVFTSIDHPGLMQVSSAGGEPEPVTFPHSDETHKNPSFSPDGKTLLYSIGERGQRPSRLDRIGAISLESGIAKELGSGASPKAIGSEHLVFFKNNALWASAFDADRLELTGESKPITDGVLFRNMAYYAFASDGTLTYVPHALQKRSLAWVDRGGDEERLAIELQHYIGARISPNGEQVSVTILGPEGPDLWLHSLTRGTWDRLTFDESQEWSVVWDPRGDYVYFSAGRVDELYRATTDGSAVVEQLTTTAANEVANSITPDGRHVLYHTFDVDTLNDLAVLTMDDEPFASSLLRTEFDEAHGRISPDGRWLLYVSNRSGRPEVYVRPYPDIETGVWQVSTNGASQPVWANSGNEIFYWGKTHLMAVDIETEPTFSPGDPRSLFSLQDEFGRIRKPFISPDASDERFLMTTSSTDESFPFMRIMIVQNWFSEVMRELE